MIRRLSIILLGGVICLLGVTSALAVEYNEAPVLRVKVAAGELPPVEERLPEEPLVVEPLEEIGQYGGEVVGASMWGPTSFGTLKSFFMVESLLQDYTTVDTLGKPNIVKSWALSEEAKTVTLYLRRGMRWSDGAPFTADDFLFWYEDILLNDELTPLKPAWTMHGGELMKMEKVDDYTVRLRFATSFPFEAVAVELGEFGVWGYAPKHYLKNLHIKYNPKANELAKEKGLEHWYQLFPITPSTVWFEEGPVGYPVLTAFMPAETELTYLRAVRNPYYWKVDPAGNQLPYIDSLMTLVIDSPEVENAKMLAGDFTMSQTSDLEMLPALLENAERGNYRLFYHTDDMGPMWGGSFNLTYAKDTVLRDIFRDVRFRRAMSLAMDRDEMNEVISQGLAIPSQATVFAGSKYYREEYARAYADYDPEKANALLDEMGLKWDEKQEYRLRKDGKRLGVVIEFSTWHLPILYELMKEYWEAVGVETTIKAVPFETLSLRHQSNDVQFGGWNIDFRVGIHEKFCFTDEALIINTQ